MLHRKAAGLCLPPVNLMRAAIDVGSAKKRAVRTQVVFGASSQKFSDSSHCIAVIGGDRKSNARAFGRGEWRTNAVLVVHSCET